MQEIRYNCDVCKKEMNTDNIYYSVGVNHRFATITKPVPNNIECCSRECVEKWLINISKMV